MSPRLERQPSDTGFLLADQLNDVSFVGDQQHKDRCTHLRHSWSESSGAKSVTTLSSDAPLLPAANLNRGQGLGFKVSLSLNDTSGVRAQPRAAWCCLLTPDLVRRRSSIDGS